MSNPPNANQYSRYVKDANGRWYGYLFTDSKGAVWADLLPVHGPLSHASRVAARRASVNHQRLHHGHHLPRRGGQPHHSQAGTMPSGLNQGENPGHRRFVPPFASEDLDDRRIRELAIAINRNAGSVGTGRAIVEFYALSLTGAVIIVGAPVAGQAVNEFLFGSAEERIFYESWRYTEGKIADYIARYGGRIISETRLGGWIIRFLGFGSSPVTLLAWKYASRFWALGAGGTITIILADSMDEASYLWTQELPRLVQNVNVFSPFKYL